MHRACLVLPPRARFAGEALPQEVARALGRADKRAGPGAIASLFEVLPRGWPAAAVTRQAERGDAAGATWLRADPAYVRPDINGARVLAVGEALGLDDAAAESLLRPLRPLFGDAGMPIDAGAPNAWYLRLDGGAPLPEFAPPEDAIGADFFEHMPPGPEGRRWRALLSEAQVLLHHHPINAERQSRGLAPVNSIWFWGAGRLPDRVATTFTTIRTPDSTVRAFARAADVSAEPLAPWGAPDSDVAYDLRNERRLDRILSAWLEPALADVTRGGIAALDLRWGDDACFEVRRSQSLRFWRRPLRVLAEQDAG